jgi:GNAT superfamily N-acetyltransferase
MSHPLDRPIWNALGSRHAGLAVGTGRARRYRPAVVPFAAAEDESAESLSDLANLVGPSETVLLLQAPTIVVPPSMVATVRARGVQMVADPDAIPDDEPTDIVPLGPSDAVEMLDLATLTKPGPFTLEAQRLGRFFGVRIDGRLAAMAGERMALPGWVEVSGVCVHPDFRGRGLARRLSVHVARRIVRAGDRPFLQAYATNEAAIALYRSIGFSLRTGVDVAAIVRPE